MIAFKNVDEVLDFAIKSEEAAHDFYMELSKKVEKPWMQKALVDFAREEAGHKAKLLEIKKGKTLAPAEEKVLDLKLAEYVADVKPSLDMNYEQALVVAMKNEKVAYKLYMDLARVVDERKPAQRLPGTGTGRGQAQVAVRDRVRRIRLPGRLKQQSIERTIMKEQKGAVTFQGSPLTLLGTLPAIGDKAPAFTAQANDLAAYEFAPVSDKIRIIATAPSLDTAVCDTQTRKFNMEAANLGEGVEILTITMDLPFAQARWCGSAGIDRVVTLSDQPRRLVRHGLRRAYQRVATAGARGVRR